MILRKILVTFKSFRSSRSDYFLCFLASSQNILLLYKIIYIDANESLKLGSGIKLSNF